MYDKFNNLFIFEMANNHMGNLSHGVRIINELKEIVKDFDFNFGIKLQYRNLDTFIHPDYQDRVDIKYIDRFVNTRLMPSEFLTLRNEIVSCGFIPICTPFDEASVDLIESHGFDIIKIASASFTDWPLLERIVLTDHPIIASTAGATLNEIDQVVSFLSHRKKDFCLMHCVGEYPTPGIHLELNQINFFKKRYPDISIGYSTHEHPYDFDPIKIAIAKGATVFERHVGIETDKYPINEYSSTPDHIEDWLMSAQYAFNTCGTSNKRRPISEQELSDLNGLKRAVFAKTIIPEGEAVTPSNTFYAIPTKPSQLLANDVSKYNSFIAKHSLQENDPVMFYDIKSTNSRDKVLSVIKQVKQMLRDSKTPISDRMDFELSHHYGIEKIEKTGAIIINCINREYCKKLIVVLPGQSHPIHYHKKKEETFHVLCGSLDLTIDTELSKGLPGDTFTVNRETPHSWSSTFGAIFEEISTTHYKNDSYYEDESILKNKNRKTEMTFFSDWMNEDLK
ncbi:MAG: N-acetylneuraminate synthase family protein [Candidatus Peribacteraceae bacterium]|nr:N-acetylneuraminate synthase family protein [Candidatus Peribacteraceae bacterium]